MRPASPMPYFRTRDFPSPFNKTLLVCTASVQDEIIASFDYYAEIKEVGKELLKNNQHTKPAASFPRFQAYIRQSKTFYETATLLHHRASPLNYYYSFMNLAKALIFIRTPAFVDQHLKHGITPSAKNGALRGQSVRTLDTGVFPLFYSLITKKKLPKSSSKIIDLLSYASDVEFEYFNLRYGTPSSFRTKLALCVEANRTNGFPLLGILNANSKNFKPIEQRLARSFDEVVVPNQSLKSIFDISAEQVPAYRFFEGRAISTTSSAFLKSVDSIQDMICANPFNDDFLFTLNRPIRSPRMMAMNEMLAIYALMFFLGSLVRYRPDILENMLSTRDAWILERFIKAAPLTFLRHARNMVDQRYLVFAAR